MAQNAASLQSHLHNSIEASSLEQIQFALTNQDSPLRFLFLQFVAHEFVDWVSNQQDLDPSDFKSRWEEAFMGRLPHSASPDSSYSSLDSVEEKELSFISIEANDIDEKAQLKREPTPTPLDHRPFPLRTPSLDKLEVVEATEKRKPSKLMLMAQNEQDGYAGTLVFDEASPRKRRPSILRERNAREFMRPIVDYPVLVPTTQRPSSPLSQEKMRLLTSELCSLTQNDLDENELEDLFCLKLHLCCTTFDFTRNHHPQEMRARGRKSQILEDLNYYIKTTKNWYSARSLTESFKMIHANLFRSLPEPPELEEDLTDFRDPSWQHLHMVYEFALQIVITSSFDKQILMDKIAQTHFTVKLITTSFASCDLREREYAKTILHRVYGRMMPLRPGIRNEMSAFLLQAVYGTRKETGISDLLEIYCSIIHGFSTPIKDAHVSLFQDVLIPLLKVEKLHKFREQLLACMAQFLFKKPSLVPVAVGAVLKFWPRTSPKKEEIFLLSLETILGISMKTDFDWTSFTEISDRLISQIIQSMYSDHHIVASRAFDILVNEGVIHFLNEHGQNFISELIGAFEVGKTHWCFDVQHVVTKAWPVFREYCHVEDEKIAEQPGLEEPSASVLSLSDSDVIDDSAKVCVGDLVKLRKGQGRVRFIGPMDEKRGLFYGIEMSRPVGRSNGQINRRTYFSTQANHGLFTKFKRILDILERNPEQPEDRISVGDTVHVQSKSCTAVVRFVGQTHFGRGRTRGMIWFGVELHEKTGNHDGAARGIRYFACPEGYGLFVRKEQLVLIRHVSPNKIGHASFDQTPERISQPTKP